MSSFEWVGVAVDLLNGARRQAVCFDSCLVRRIRSAVHAALPCRISAVLRSTVLAVESTLQLCSIPSTTTLINQLCYLLAAAADQLWRC